MLATDSRAEVEMGLLGDPRARHFWDEQRVVGRWLAEAGVGEPPSSGVVWDAYFLFGPDAVWDERPAPLAGRGAPVVSSTDALERDLRPLLG